MDGSEKNEKTFVEESSDFPSSDTFSEQNANERTTGGNTTAAVDENSPQAQREAPGSPRRSENVPVQVVKESHPMKSGAIVAGEGTTAPVMRIASNSSSDIPRASIRSKERNMNGSSTRSTEDGVPPLVRGRSSTSSTSRKSAASEPTFHEQLLMETSFDPADLLQEGLDEWHDRNLNLQLLKRSRTLLASRKQGFPPVDSEPTLRTARFAVYPEIENDDIRETGGGYIAHSGIYPTPERKISGKLAPNTYMEMPRLQMENNKAAQKQSDEKTDEEFQHDYQSALSVAPHATLIRVVMLYHQALIKNGLLEEAEKIVDMLSELQFAEDVRELELEGMDVLLKDGLLNFLLKVQPHLPPIPSQVVKFKHVTYTSTILMDTGYESVYTKLKECLSGPLKKSKIRRVISLNDVTGYLMPGTLTLVLGPPGCGRNAIHRVLAGRAGVPGSSMEGEVTYNGVSVKQIKSQRLVSIVGQVDSHLPPLTVRETVEFARDCSQFYRTKHWGKELLDIAGDVLKVGQDPKVETNLSMMGLKRIGNRIVGSPMVPSLTEDERHRLSVAEMFAGTYAVYMFDQLNTGQDESLTYDLVTSVRIFTRVRGITFVASLIQPSSDVFDLFDRVIVLDRSHIVYQGPRQDALPYFEKIGYVKPRHLSTGEFLEEVTTSEGVQYLQPGFPRLDLQGFVTAYKKSDDYRDICRIVDTPEVHQEVWVQGTNPLGLNFIQSHPNTGQGISQPVSTLVASLCEKGSLVEASMDHTGMVQPGDEVVAVGGPKGMLQYVKIDPSKVGLLFDQTQEPVRLQLERPFVNANNAILHQQYAQEFVLNPWPEFLCLLKRELQITLRNKVALYIRGVQVLVLSLFVGFMFFRVKNDPNQLDMNLVRSVFFVSLLDMTLFNLGQLPSLMEERVIFYKQQGAHFFRPGTYLLAKIVGSIPFSLAEATSWTVIVYFLTGLSTADSGWHFFVFYLIISLTVLNGAALVRFMSAFAPDGNIANSIISIIIGVFILFAGFLVPRFKVPKYWIWMYYINPLQWALTSLLINEFHSGTYDLRCEDVLNLANIPQCNGRPNNTVGHAFLAKGQFYTGYSWIGVAVAVILGWFSLFTSLTYYSLARIRHVPKTVVTPAVEERLLQDLKVETNLSDAESGSMTHSVSLAAEPVTLSWHELSYDILIPTIGKTHTILSYISGWAEPGQMVGVLGCTGAGKSTLLNCLAGRKVALGRIGGSIYANGYIKDHAGFQQVSGYVDRLDAYSPQLTIREAVSLSAALQLSKILNIDQRRKFVDEVLSLMELKPSENLLVRSLGMSVLSKAQALRLATAVELARNPSILFLDEPTKGLDSRSSHHLIRSLKHIADTGRVVIASLQLPSQRYLSYFTNVQILKRGGETVYFGPAGYDGDSIRTYFESIPGTPLCPLNTSIATYAIDVVGDGVVERKAFKDYAFEYRVSELALQNHVQLQRFRRSKGILGREIVATYEPTFWDNALSVIKRVQLEYWRNVSYSWGRLVSSVMTGLLLGSVFFNVNIHSTAGMNVRASSIFISCVLLSLSNAQAVVPQIISLRHIIEREKATKHFNILLTNIAWTLAELPYLMVSTMIFTFIFLIMEQSAIFNAADFFRFWFLLFECCLAITYLGMFLAVASPLPQIAAVLVTIIIGVWVATSGLVVPKKKILHQFIWIFWTNPLQYAIHGLTVVAFYCNVNKESCLNDGLNPSCARDPTSCLLCNCPRLHDNNNVFVWTQIQFNRTLKHYRLPYDMLALFLLCVLFRTMTFLARKWRSSKK